MRAAAEVAHATLIPGGLKMLVSFPPDPTLVLWPNMSVEAKTRSAMSLFSTLIYLSLLIFLAPIFTGIQWMGVLENLTDTLPFLEPVLDWSSAVKALIGGFLPVIVFTIF